MWETNTDRMGVVWFKSVTGKVPNSTKQSFPKSINSQLLRIPPLLPTRAPLDPKRMKQIKTRARKLDSRGWKSQLYGICHLV